jgi:hypothetical protein
MIPNQWYAILDSKEVRRAGQNIRLVSFAAQNASPRPAARRQNGT